MFGVDFSEILVIMVVALVVLGPERLPVVARTMGRWWGGLQRYINRVKADVTTSMELEELRQMEQRIKAEADALERSVHKAGNQISDEMRAVEKHIEQLPQDSGNPAPPAEPPLPPK